MRNVNGSCCSSRLSTLPPTVGVSVLMSGAPLRTVTCSASAADRQLGVDAHGLPRLDPERLGGELLEARRARRRAGRGPASGSGTRRRRCASVVRGSRERRLHFGERDRGAGQDGAGGVGGDADDGAVGRLGERRRPGRPRAAQEQRASRRVFTSTPVSPSPAKVRAACEAVTTATNVCYSSVGRCAHVIVT